MTLEGIHLLSKRPGWVTIELNKQALDYFREGITNKVNSLEREMIMEGESVRESRDFANKLKEFINSLRQELELT